MYYHIRDFTPDDYEAVVAIDNLVWPNSVSVPEEWQHWDQTRNPEYKFQRYVLETNGRILAFGSLGEPHWSYRPGKYFLNIIVHPNHERRGFGSAVYDHFMAELATLEPKAVRLMAGTREDKPQSVRFLEKRGFQQAMRFPRSHLDVRQFDPSRFSDKVQAALNSGLVIKSVAQLSRKDPDWKRKLYELDWELSQDVPYHDAFTKQPFEQFEKGPLSSPNFLPAAWYIALDGDRWVGMSALWRNLGDEKRLGTGLTGVARDYRRRGLATALKVHAIEYAREHGYELIETDNEENNPMFQLNLQLGFVPQPAELDFVKELNQ